MWDYDSDYLDDVIEDTDDRCCPECGALLKVGYESYEVRGHIERDRILYCPNCD